MNKQLNQNKDCLLRRLSENRKLIFWLIPIIGLPYTYFLLYIALIIIMYTGLYFTGFLVYNKYNPSIPLPHIDSYYYLFQSLLCIFALMFYTPLYNWVVKLRKLNPNAVTSKKARLPEFVKYGVISFGMSGLTYLLFLLIEKLPASIDVFGIQENLFSFQKALERIPEQNLFWAVLSLIVLKPLVEELLFRGLQYYCAERVGGEIFAVLVSAVGFGLWHQDNLQRIYMLINGIILGLIFYYGRSILVVYCVHVLYQINFYLWACYNGISFQNGIRVVSMIMIIPMIYLLIAMMLEIRKGKRIDTIDNASVGENRKL